jgi:hypothetical protein
MFSVSLSTVDDKSTKRSSKVFIGLCVSITFYLKLSKDSPRVVCIFPTFFPDRVNSLYAALKDFTET